MLNNNWHCVEIPKLDRVHPPVHNLGDTWIHHCHTPSEGTETMIGIITGIKYVSEYVLMPYLKGKGHVWRYSVTVYAGSSEDNRRYPYVHEFDHLAEYGRDVNCL